MHVVVYCPAAHRSVVGETLRRQARIFSEWPAFEQATTRADVLVVVIEQLAGVPGAADVALLHGSNPWTGIVLVTAADADNLMLVPYARPHELVVLSRLDGRLANAVNRAANVLRVKLVDAVRASSLSLWMVRALTTVLTADPPLTSVDAWCDRVACAPGTLRYHFAHESLASAAVTPKDFLEAALLLFALERVPSARSWYRLACAVGLDRRRLQRAAARVAASRTGAPGALDRTALLMTVAHWLEAETYDSLGRKAAADRLVDV